MDEATLVGVLQGENEKEKIEVHAIKRDGFSLLQLRYMTWGPGVGWFCQKSMELDEEQEGQLLQILEARRKWVTHQRKVGLRSRVPSGRHNQTPTGRRKVGTPMVRDLMRSLLADHLPPGGSEFD